MKMVEFLKECNKFQAYIHKTHPDPKKTSYYVIIEPNEVCGFHDLQTGDVVSGQVFGRVRGEDIVAKFKSKIRGNRSKLITLNKKNYKWEDLCIPDGQELIKNIEVELNTRYRPKKPEES